MGAGEVSQAQLAELRQAVDAGFAGLRSDIQVVRSESTAAHARLADTVTNLQIHYNGRLLLLEASSKTLIQAREDDEHDKAEAVRERRNFVLGIFGVAAGSAGFFTWLADKLWRHP